MESRYCSSYSLLSAARAESCLSHLKDWTSPPDLTVDIAIAGGGLAGLALAVGLQERGIDAHVFEKAPALRTDSATAVALAINAARALDGLKPGLATKMQELGNSAVLVHSIFRDDFGKEKRVPVTHKHGEYFQVGWRFAQEVLARHVRDESKVHCSHRLLSYKGIQGGAAVQFCLEQDKSSLQPHAVKIVHAKLIVGADGMWSAVRKLMVGDSPRYLNYIDWNALVYTPQGKVFKYPVGTSNLIYHTNGKVVGHIIDVGRGYCLWDLRIWDPTGELAEDLLSRSKKWDKSTSKQRALDRVNGLKGWEDLQACIEATHENEIYERKNSDRLPISKWSDAGGHVLLIGDAAHAMYSAPGMGARMAFEDAHQLAVLLEEAMRPGVDQSESIPQAVHKFEEIRIPRVHKVHNFATEMTGQACFESASVKILSSEEKAAKMNELIKWTRQYPENMHGDPQSKYFTP